MVRAQQQIFHLQGGEFVTGFVEFPVINPLTPELNPSAQRCLPRFFTGDFNF
jgi:hypothetical protein